MIDENKIMTNDRTSLFIVEGPGQYQFLHLVSVWRVMWRGKKRRIILRGISPHAHDFLANFESGTLEVLYKEHGPYHIYLPEEAIFRFVNCAVKNKWVPNLTILYPDETQAVVFFIELECDDIQILKQNPTNNQ